MTKDKLGRYGRHCIYIGDCLETLTLGGWVHYLTINNTQDFKLAEQKLTSEFYRITRDGQPLEREYRKWI